MNEQAPSSKEDPARNEGMGSCNSALGHYLDAGNAHPFDQYAGVYSTNDDGAPRPVDHASDWAYRAARGVIDNLQDRRGFHEPFGNIDHDLRVEIVAALAGIIRLAKGES